MKKQYKVKDISAQEYSEAAADNRAGASAVDIPLLVLNGENAKAVPGGIFELPSVKDTDKQTLEIAYRILGMVITPSLLNHLPAEHFDSDDVGTLLAHFPFEYHRRFGPTYSNRVCSDSTRTRPCAACKARAGLFRKDSPYADKIGKHDILDAGFGTKHVSVFVAHVWFDGEDRGICLCSVPRSNPHSKNKKNNSFFDRIDVLKTPKKLMASEVLPIDYFGYGGGARWITAEYKRSVYTPEDAATTVDGKRKSRGGEYWELLDVKSAKEVDGIGKASEIWWPTVGKQTGEEFFDVHAALNFPDPEELQKAVEDSIKHMLDRNVPQLSSEASVYKTESGTPVKVPTWQELNEMPLEKLLIVGQSLGGDIESLTLIGENNIALLRRNLAKMMGVKPTPIASAESSPAETSEARTDIDASLVPDEDLPF